jgi:hypothetical protein
VSAECDVRVSSAAEAVTGTSENSGDVSVSSNFSLLMPNFTLVSLCVSGKLKLSLRSSTCRVMKTYVGVEV